ncbi:MAG TPA: diguanylate cyclase [Candidatus Limnocylindrales bacterium]|nr:diguanylate cyclase [Candidatus Limnocylindrales bacterium]
MTGRDPVESAYERRIRLASELATWGIAGILVASAALPTTTTISRIGLLFSAALLAAFAILWFHLIPERIFGRLRFTVGTAITQLVASILLALTGGSESNYFVFFMFPTLATTFAMRVSSTLVVGSIGLIALVALLFGDGFLSETGAAELQLGAVRISAFAALIAMTVLISRTMQETRGALRQRSDELATQNVELEVSHSTALAIARARDLGELLRAVYESATAALGSHRVFFFQGPDAIDHAWTVAADGPIEAFEPDRRLRDSPRQRAMRTRQTVIVNDMTEEPMVGDRVRTAYGVASGLFVPLIHRGELIGLVTFNDAAPRSWTRREVRIAEIIAESMAPSVASFLALEDVREERETLAGRMKVLEGMNQLVEALALAQDEATTGQVAARAVAQGFRLMAATTLFVDPSVALLEPIGTAGAARAHAVVNGPTSCPAIRSGRVFQVATAADPVICPYMPFAEGTSGYVCVPLMAGGEPLGALFMEPTVGSTLEDAFVRAAADRVALSLANRRVLETAQRQATTDGLTGLHNRHFLREQLRLMHSLATRHGQSYAAIAMDVDGLKQVNDTFGHETGDLVLRGLANTVRKTARTSDVAVRTGGDEFLILVPLAGVEDGRILAERLREAITQQGRADPHSAVTISFGVAAWRASRTAEEVLEAADAALYAAKRGGKDRVVVEALPAAEESAPTPP